MNKLLSLFLLIVLLLLTPPSSKASRQAFNISEDLHQSILEGLHSLYDFDFEKANATFKSLEAQKHQHPMISFGLASSEWWRVSALVLEPDQEESAPFLKAVTECINISEKIIEQGDKTGEAHLVLGGALGLLGRWEATNGKWLSAYFKGKKAINYLEKATEINPELFDAYMGIGMFNYYVATLPDVVRVLAFLGRGADPSVGLNQLHQAAERGTYAQTPSNLFLCQIYSQMEKKPEVALPLVEALRKEYPKSPFIHMVHIISLYNADKTDLLMTEAHDMLIRFNENIYPSSFSAQGHFAVGAAHLKKKEWTTALEHFSIGTETGFEKDPWRTWCRLYVGFCLDAMKERDKAKAQYRAVLKLPRRWGSHDIAKMRLKKPFLGTPEDLKELSL